jgi:hypothetical protein
MRDEVGKMTDEVKGVIKSLATAGKVKLVTATWIWGQ